MWFPIMMFAICGFEHAIANMAFIPLGLMYGADADYARWPFFKPQYLLLNLAMGGDLGGPVPANFTADQMEVEYVRVYQR
jgi:formate/nitrite transporter FocA (FNT family)